jgi:transposase-like protein
MNKQQINGTILALGAAERSPDERSETGRSEAAPKADPTAAPNPEVRPLAKRRRFTAQYKLKILAEADAATAPGAIGALLRREGLYSSMLANWRKERATGLEPRCRGPKPQLDPSAKQVQQLRRDNERLTERLRKAEIIIDVQKKVASLLGRTLATPDPEDLL